MGCHLVVKRSNLSQPERNHLAPTPNRHFPVLNSSYSGYKKKDNIQQIRQVPVFQSTLRNSHKWQWDWQVEEEVSGFQWLSVAFPSARVQRRCCARQLGTCELQLFLLCFWFETRGRRGSSREGTKLWLLFEKFLESFWLKTTVLFQGIF